MSELTVEDLQKQLLEQQEKIKQLEIEKDNLNKDLDESNKSLDESRKIVNKLWASGTSTTGNPFPGNNMGDEQEVETPEEFIDSFVETAVKNMKKVFGEDKVGYNH